MTASGERRTEKYYIDAQGSQYLVVGDGAVLNVTVQEANFSARPLIDVSGGVTNPYRGLDAFRESDGPLFFGRDNLSGALAEAVGRAHMSSHLLVVSGASGVGKSSLLRAGLTPVIRDTGLPGLRDSGNGRIASPIYVSCLNDPYSTLALQLALILKESAGTIEETLRASELDFASILCRALRVVYNIPGGRVDLPLILILDQFERFFLKNKWRPGTADSFLAAVAFAAGRSSDDLSLLFVVSIRGDCEGRLAEVEGWADAVQGRYLVSGMNEVQLQQAIVKPAQAAGASVEAALVELLVNEVRSGAPRTLAGVRDTSKSGGLPLLSNALSKLWDRRIGNEITLRDYERIGGIHQALEHDIDSAYSSLSHRQREFTRALFISLTETDSEGITSSAPLSLAELNMIIEGEDANDAAQVLDLFGSRRFLTLDSESIQLTHESIITAWRLLSVEWLPEVNNHRIAVRKLNDEAKSWSEAPTSRSSFLLRGIKLDAALETRDRAISGPYRVASLTKPALNFIKASELQRRRQRGRLWLTIVALSTVTLVLLGLIIAVVKSSSASNRSRDRAISRLLIDKSTLDAASDPQRSRLDALAAWSLNQSPEARESLIEAALTPGISVTKSDDGPVTSVAWSSDSTSIVGTTIDGAIHQWSASSSGAEVRKFSAHTGSGTAIAFSPNGMLLASAGSDDTARLWYANSSREFGLPLHGHTAPVESIEFSPDSSLLVTGSDDGTVRIWSTATQHVVGSPIMIGSPVSSVLFSKDGNDLVVGSPTAGIFTVGVAVRNVRLLMSSSKLGRVTSLTMRKADGAIYVTSDTGTVREITLPGDEKIVTPSFIANDPATGRFIHALAISPDGRVMAAVSSSDILVWDVESGQPFSQSPMSGHEGEIYSLAFSPNGSELASAGSDGTVRLWQIPEEREIGQTVKLSSNVLGSEYVASANSIRAVGLDGKVSLFGIPGAGRKDETVLLPSKDVDPNLISPSGLLVGGITQSGHLQVWDAKSGQLLANISGFPSGTEEPVVFSPNGDFVAVGGPDGRVRMYSVTRGILLAEFSGPSGFISSLVFSENNSLLAAGVSDGSTWVWNTAQTSSSREFEGHFNLVDALAFSPDSSLLASAASSSNRSDPTMVWDLKSGSRVATLTDASSTVASYGYLVFSPDGKSLVSLDGFEQALMRIWDVRSQRLVGLPSYLRATGAWFTSNGLSLVLGDGSTYRFLDISYLTDPIRVVCDLYGGVASRQSWSEVVPSGPSYRKLCA